ncbi:MAG: DUF4325 domain-containing protein [Eubacteriales bacterium]|nr:DUF4325 domain-containing protein [Eubacteriales bacterium]
MGKVITIHKMNHPRDVSTFVKKIRPILNDDSIYINFNTHNFYPSACVPISGIIDNLKQQGKNIHIRFNKNTYLGNSNFNIPYSVKEHTESLKYPFAKLWKFSTNYEIQLLVEAFSNEIQALTECSKGLIDSLEWSLNEAMDNVIQHSLIQEGYIMGVFHKSSNYLLLTIFDNGQGIFNSFMNSQYTPRNAIDAISLSIQEGKTRDKRIGQGNGLWGLYNIIQHNKGRLTITSHGSALMLKSDGSVNKFEKLPLLDTHNGTTIVDISFNCKEEVSITEALGGYTPIDINLENMIDDDSNNIIFTLEEQGVGFGTRQAGERLRNKVINLFERSQYSNKLCIDFRNVSIISSSFADEFIGKLILKYGFYKFNYMVNLINTNPTVEVILNRSVSQRMAYMYFDNEIEFEEGEYNG